MEARKISVKLRRDPRETAERHSQANPLTLECTLATGESVTETMELRAELHAAQTPATTPLAATAPVNMTSGSTGPWDLVFSGAQMNQTVLPDSSTDFWLVIYATDADDNLFTLGKIALTLTFDNVSQVTPAPPDPALFLDLGGTKWKTAENYLIDDVVALSGSIYVCTANNTSSTTNRPGSGASWTSFWTLFSGGGGGGDVTGPASSTDNAITRFDGTTGKLLQNSSATVSDVGGIAADTLAISTTPTGAGGTGIFRYDTGEKVPEVGIDGITLKIGVQEYVRVYNSTASTLTKGQIVYINGAQGNRVSVALSDASSESTSAGTIGFVAQSITAGSEGFVQTSGPMYSLNTIGLTAGALLFLSETAGQWTTTEPAAPAHGVRLGYVERVHATVGSVFIKIDNGYELGELHNVSDGVTGAIAFLVKNASTNVWESKNAADSRTAMGAGTGNGTVTAVSVATANGVSGTSSGGATPALTIALGAITPSSVNGITLTNGGSGALTVTGTASVSGTNTGDQTITLTGDVTGSGTGSFAATIAASAVTYAKMQAVSAASRLLGRGTAGTTAVREISLGTGLSMSGDVLSATATGGGTNTIMRLFPKDNEPPASAFATIDTRNSHPVLDFPSTGSPTAIFRTYVPQGATFAGSGTALTIYIDAAATSATSGVVGWSVSLERLVAGGQDLDSDNFGTAQSGSQTISGTSGVMCRTTVAFTQAQLPTSLAAGDMFRIRIQRNTSVGSNHTGDAEFVGAYIEITPAEPA
jgi:hypothetical protein